MFLPLLSVTRSLVPRRPGPVLVTDLSGARLVTLREFVDRTPASFPRDFVTGPAVSATVSSARRKGGLSVGALEPPLVAFASQACTQGPFGRSGKCQRKQPWASGQSVHSLPSVNT